MKKREDQEVTVQEEIDAPFATAPHVVLLGAGASRAALPNGDRYGRAVPLLREVAAQLDLIVRFLEDLRKLAASDFEAAYSRLYDRDAGQTSGIADALREYFAELELPLEPTIYDALLLSLRGKDAVVTFNWDPFLLQAHDRLRAVGIYQGVLPTIWFLHGNVAVGYCPQHEQVRAAPGAKCRHCGEIVLPSRLLFPVEHKDYKDGSMIEREWTMVQGYLRRAFMLTVFGYSAPATDVEAKELLRDAWGNVEDRNMEQIEIIDRPGADHDTLRELWSPFIHTHHYEIHDSFYDSWIAKHPRRTREAHIDQYRNARFIDDHPVPSESATLIDLVAWFEPLFDAEHRFMDAVATDGEDDQSS